jgi:hypothetical protein
MDAFIHRLVQRLLDPSRPLSRNRHFHTFETPEGKRALRISRRLQALARDLTRCANEGGEPVVTRAQTAQGDVVIEVRLRRLNSSRVTKLDPTEFELLCRLPGVPAGLKLA